MPGGRGGDNGGDRSKGTAAQVIIAGGLRGGGRGLRRCGKGWVGVFRRGGVGKATIRGRGRARRIFGQI